MEYKVQIDRMHTSICFKEVSFLKILMYEVNAKYVCQLLRNGIVKQMIRITDYRHTKAKSLIICIPNSNPNSFGCGYKQGPI